MYKRVHVGNFHSLGYEDCSAVYVIDKLYTCEKMTASLSIVHPKNGPLKFKRMAELGEDHMPMYGIPVCFSATKYQLDENGVIEAAVDFNIGDMRASTWQPRGARTTEPVQAIGKCCVWPEGFDNDTMLKYLE